MSETELFYKNSCYQSLQTYKSVLCTFKDDITAIKVSFLKNTPMKKADISTYAYDNG